MCWDGKTQNYERAALFAAGDAYRQTSMERL
jgi:hypothetical protein